MSYPCDALRVTLHVTRADGRPLTPAEAEAINDWIADLVDSASRHNAYVVAVTVTAPEPDEAT